MNAYAIPGLITNREQTIEIVCKEFGVTVKEVSSRSRKGNVAMARHVIAYLLVEKYNMKLQYAGFIIGRCHANVIHSVKTVKNLMQVDKEIKTKLFNILTQIRL